MQNGVGPPVVMMNDDVFGDIPVPGGNRIHVQEDVPPAKRMRTVSSDEFDDSDGGSCAGGENPEAIIAAVERAKLPIAPPAQLVRQSSLMFKLDDKDVDFADVESLVSPRGLFSKEYSLFWENTMRYESSIASLELTALLRFMQDIYEEWVCNRSYGGSSNNPIHALEQARLKFGIREQDRVGVAAIEKRWKQCSLAVMNVDIAIVQQIDTLRTHGRVNVSDKPVAEGQSAVDNVMAMTQLAEEGGELRLTDLDPMTDMTRLLDLQRQTYEHTLLAMQQTRDMLVSLDCLYRISHRSSRAQVTGLASLQINRYYHQTRENTRISNKGALMRTLWFQLARMQARRVGAVVYKPLTILGQNTGAYTIHSSIEDFVRTMTSLSENVANFELSMMMPLDSFIKDFTDRRDAYFFPHLNVNHGVYAFQGGMMDVVNKRLVFFDEKDEDVVRMKCRCDGTIKLFAQREELLRTKLIPMLALRASVARSSMEKMDDAIEIKEAIAVLKIAIEKAAEDKDRLVANMDEASEQLEAIRQHNRRLPSAEHKCEQESVDAYRTNSDDAQDKEEELNRLKKGLQEREEQLYAVQREFQDVLDEEEDLHTELQTCHDTLKMLRGLMPGEAARHGVVAEVWTEQKFPFDDFIQWLTPICITCLEGDELREMPCPCDHTGGASHSFVLSWYHQLPTSQWEKIFTDQGLPLAAVMFSGYVSLGRLNVPYGLWEEHTFVTNTRGEPKTGKTIVQRMKAALRGKSKHAYFMNWSENKFGMSMVLGTTEEERPSVIFLQDYTAALTHAMSQDQFLLTAEQATNTSWPRKNKSTLNVEGHFPHTDYSGNPPLPFTGREASRRVVTTIFPQRIRKENPKLQRTLMTGEFLQLAWKSTRAYEEWALQYSDKGLWDLDEDGSGALCKYYHDRQRDNESSNSPLLHFLESEVNEHFNIRRGSTMTFSRFKRMLGNITKGRRQEDWSLGQFQNTLRQFNIEYVNRRTTNHPDLVGVRGEWLVGIEPKAQAVPGASAPAADGAADSAPVST